MPLSRTDEAVVEVVENSNNDKMDQITFEGSGWN